jgi:hypothetical protein
MPARAVVFGRARIVSRGSPALSTAAAPHVPYRATPASTPVAAFVPARGPTAFWLVLLTVTVLAALYTFWHLGRGLIPHDDGAIGQAAERVLRGELPHRDFDDIYTGGLAYLNAWAFRLLGASFRSMRLVLFVAFVAWVPFVYYAASRFVRPLAAGAVTLLAVVWSVPNYPAPMPSWYNLFLATAGVAALLRYLEQPRRAWLLAAGVAGGLSILIKVVGLYYVAGVLLFLVFQAHASSRREGPGMRAPLYATVVTAALALFVAGLVLVVRQQPFIPEVVHFVLPGALIAAWLAATEWTRPAGPDTARFRTLAGLVVPFLAGVAIPVLLFALPYAASGALGDLAFGVFILPTKRFGAAVMHVVPLRTMWAILPFAALIAAARRWPNRFRASTIVLLCMVLGLVIAIAAINVHVYRFAWRPFYNLVPVLTVVALVVLRRERDEDGRAPHRRSQLVLLLAVTALCSLVQFPFAAPIYLNYVLPLGFLAATALYTYLRPFPSPVAAVLVGFWLVFAVTRVNTSSLPDLGARYLPFLPTKPLAIPRGGIDAYINQSEAYPEIVRLLDEHARGGYTWASPDSPEVYFLTGLRNPTRTLFDFFDDPADRTARLLAALDRHGVTAIVLNRNPEFSAPISNAMYDVLSARFPSSAEAGHFQVRWR